VWHHLPEVAPALQEAARLLKPGGRLAILDWRSDVPSPPGPPPEFRLPAADVVRALEAGGWQVQVNRPVAAYSYLIVAVQPT
jgi:SAM-dependent methyltransferase